MYVRTCLIETWKTNTDEFIQTRKTANWLAEQMTKDHHAVAILSGELDISQRADVIQRFKQGNQKVLITTNVTARGIVKIRVLLPSSITP